MSENNNLYAYMPTFCLPTTLSNTTVPTELQNAPDFNSENVEPDPSSTTSNDGYEGINWDCISKFQLPTRPSRRRAWIWTEGYDIKETKTGDRYWLCKRCHVAAKQKSHLWKETGGTSIALKHMKETHQLAEDGPVQKKRPFADAFKQPDGSLTSRDRDIVHRLMTAFNPKRFKTKLTRWIVHDNIAFNQVESPYFRDMMLELNESLGELDCLPTHRSIHDWIIKDFNKYKGIVTEHLQNALGKVHISFDLWTSRNLLTLCGIIVHFIDKQGKLCTFLLSLPEIVGSHTGVHIAESVAAIIHEFNLMDRIGYFVLDNADNNDTAITALAEEFNFDAGERYKSFIY